ncbi:hypothetical protein [Xanthobacter aminoxidans]|uniref:hypothetical protein n=1 Tax=Xanthobacter aminoxidans TaxID=186280 RepID=UPI002022BC3D|nr:hypothetical protein [Xanthobacter aminoxidans]MCL8385856.1 hypothetical protein [Xanthobacter aminoxidans]
MSRTGATFQQADLNRALRACRKAGVLDQVAVRVEKGAIVILPLAAAAGAPAAGMADAQDGVSAERLPALPVI